MAQVAEHCLKSAKDLSGLLLLYSARGSAGGLATLTSDALEGGKNNVAFGAAHTPYTHTLGPCTYSPTPLPPAVPASNRCDTCSSTPNQCVSLAGLPPEHSHIAHAQPATGFV